MDGLIAIAFIGLLLYWGLSDYWSGYPPAERKHMEAQHDHEEDYPDWEPGDPVPDGFYVYDGDGENGPCEPVLHPIEIQTCDTCGTEQEVRKHITYNPADPTDAAVLACGHINY